MANNRPTEMEFRGGFNSNVQPVQPEQLNVPTASTLRSTPASTPLTQNSQNAKSNSRQKQPAQPLPLHHVQQPNYRNSPNQPVRTIRPNRRSRDRDSPRAPGPTAPVILPRPRQPNLVQAPNLMPTQRHHLPQQRIFYSAAYLANQHRFTAQDQNQGQNTRMVNMIPPQFQLVQVHPMRHQQNLQNVRPMQLNQVPPEQLRRTPGNSNFVPAAAINTTDSSIRTGPSKYSKFFYMFIGDPRGVQRTALYQDFRKLEVKSQLEEFLSSLSLDQEAYQQRYQLLKDLQVLLSRDYPHCCIYPFGSFLTGLGDVESDVDVYIDAFGVTKGFPLPKTESGTLDILNRCQRILRRAKDPHSNRTFCSQLIPIREARVPILKLTHSSTKVNCDLSFENLISLRNSQMVSLYMKLHPVVRPIIVFIRFWAKFHSLTGSNSIKNYCLILMILVFLSTKKIIPPVSMLQNMKEKERRAQTKAGEVVKNPDEIDGWDTSFAENVDDIRAEFKSSLSLEEAGGNIAGAVLKLAEEFFEMFGYIDLAAVVVCSYTSELLPKNLFAAGNEEDLPVSLEKYKEWSSRQSGERRLHVKTPLCVQDPFILSFNVGRVTPLGVKLKFQVACKQTAEIMKSGIKSLLCTCVTLPKELGDKKFLNMQEKQKITIDLKREIDTFITHGENVPSEVTEEDSDACMGTMHRLPLEQIIDKNSIRFGKGWECVADFQPSKDFLRMFAKEMSTCKLNGHGSNGLLKKVKLLWISIANDFLSIFWGKCFNLEITREEREKKDRVFADAPFSVRTRPKYEAIFNEKEKKAKRTSSETDVISPERVKLISDKLQELGDMEEKVVYMKLNCSAFDNTWHHRDRIWNDLLQKLTKDKEQVEETPGENAGEGTSKSASKKKSKKRSKSKKSKSSQSKVVFDPLEIQEQVTAAVLENLKIRPSSKGSGRGKKKPILNFITYIKLDNSLVDDLPTLYFVFEKGDCSPSNYGEGVSSIAETIYEIFYDFAFYRLTKWLELDEEEKVPSVLELPTPPNPGGELAKEEDYDYLLPPTSSSSECSSPVVFENEV